VKQPGPRDSGTKIARLRAFNAKPHGLRDEGELEDCWIKSKAGMCARCRVLRKNKRRGGERSECEKDKVKKAGSRLSSRKRPGKLTMANTAKANYAEGLAKGGQSRVKVLNS